MDASPIICNIIDAPLPPKLPRGKPAHDRETMFDLLGTMEAGGTAIEVNRSKRSVQGYVHRFRVKLAPGAQYVIRDARPGWTRLWRTK
jgi:hypothetical protein